MKSNHKVKQRERTRESVYFFFFYLFQNVLLISPQNLNSVEKRYHILHTSKINFFFNLKNWKTIRYAPSSTWLTVNPCSYWMAVKTMKYGRHKPGTLIIKVKSLYSYISLSIWTIYNFFYSININAVRGIYVYFLIDVEFILRRNILSICPHFFLIFSL